MPLEVSQEPGEPGITLKTTASEGEKLPVDEAAKAESKKNLADVQSKVEIENQAPDLISDLHGANKKG
ncbi:hypothetical protein QFC22_006073 [Naganishia vaughanmartiniae]|uniref:Uncharacterized protein n=1 Tax=Naganishia vaughanmartiniae TaxID=1424756 RepID=A0ACC2WPZ7_9TREE|nr:hypothetical protein QFC22_006073 [Naganishia vaughanmartiniae]